MSRVLIAILSCHKYPERRQAQRDTWLANLRGADYRFFLGGSESNSWNSDEVYLNCPDIYELLCLKTKAAMRWSSAMAYEFTFKCDDDSFTIPKRLLTSGFEQHAYSGFTEAGWEPKEDFRYCRGGSGYWTDRRSTQIVASHMMERRHCEDVAVGHTLSRHGIVPVHDERYRHVENQGELESALADPLLISLHKCNPEQMRFAHHTLTQ